MAKKKSNTGMIIAIIISVIVIGIIIWGFLTKWKFFSKNNYEPFSQEFLKKIKDGKNF